MLKKLKVRLSQEQIRFLLLSEKQCKKVLAGLDFFMQIYTKKQKTAKNTFVFYADVV